MKLTFGIFTVDQVTFLWRGETTRRYSISWERPVGLINYRVLTRSGIGTGTTATETICKGLFAEINAYFEDGADITGEVEKWNRMIAKTLESTFIPQGHEHTPQAESPKESETRDAIKIISSANVDDLSFQINKAIEDGYECDGAIVVRGDCQMIQKMKAVLPNWTTHHISVGDRIIATR